MEKSTINQSIKDTTTDSERNSDVCNGEITAVTIDPKLQRTIDWRIMSLAFLCYFLQFLDKVVINYARVMGLEKDLGMHGQDFSWMATGFFIAYAIAEIPQGVLLQKFPVSKVLGCNVLCWGVLLACSAAAKNYGGMLACRVLLGACESIITPALVLITSQWYTKRQATPRTGIWYCGLGAGQIMGGLVSWAAYSSPASSFSGWRIMMLAVGGFNTIIAISVLFLLPNGVESASFLTPAEKEQILHTLTLDHSGNGNKVFQRSALLSTLRDPAIWLLFLATVLIVIPSGVITTFSATLVAGFGYSSRQAALLNMPSGIVSIFATLSSTFAVLLNFPRWLGIIFLLVPTLIGAALMSFTSTQASALAGIYLINFCVAPLALIYALVGSNTQGYTQKIVANGLVQVGFSIANIIGPQTFREGEKPGYISAKVTVLAVNVGAMGMAVALRGVYGWRNKRGEGVGYVY